MHSRRSTSTMLVLTILSWSWRSYSQSNEMAGTSTSSVSSPWAIFFERGWTTRRRLHRRSQQMAGLRWFLSMACSCNKQIYGGDVATAYYVEEHLEMSTKESMEKVDALQDAVQSWRKKDMATRTWLEVV